MELLLSLSHTVSVLAVQVFAQTAAVIIAGLLLCLAIGNHSPLLRNLLCRWTLIALLIAPAAMFAFRQSSVPSYSVILPLDTATVPTERSSPAPFRTEPSAVADISHINGKSSDIIANTGNNDGPDALITPHIVLERDEVPAAARYSPIEISAPRANVWCYIWLVYLSISLAWFLLLILGIIRLFNSFARLSFIIRTAIPAEPALCELVDAHARRLGTAVPDVLRSPFVHSPFLTGLIKPVVIAPDHLDVTDDIVLHELIHLKRHDVWWSLIGHLISLLIPIQPLIRIILEIMEDTNDLICDRAVVEQLRNPRNYAKRLVSLTALLCPGNPRDSLGLGFLPSRKSLKRRIISILEFDPSRAAPFRKRLLSACVAAVIACSLLSGYIEVRGETTSSLLSRFVFINTMKYVPGAKRIAREARTILETAERIIEEKPAIATFRKPDAHPPVVAETTPPPRFDIADNSGTDIMERSQNIAMAEISELASPLYTDELPSSRTVHAPIELTSMTVEEYVAEFDMLAELAGRGMPVSAGTSVMPMDAGIPGTPRIIAEFSAAKPVNVTCDYDLGSLNPSSTKEEIEALEYLRSLDKNKQEVAWSPDGVTLAFTDNNRIWLVPVSGGEPVLVYEYKQDGHLVNAISDLCFTPDGGEIIFTKNIYDPALGSVIYVMEYSGDMTYVSFSNPIPNIESVNLETGEHRVLVEEAYMGTLSRDGSCLFYIRFDPDFYKLKPDEFHDLPMVLDFKTGRRMVLSTMRQRYGKPTFSPDDSYLILPCFQYGHPEQLHRMNLSGGDPAPVTAYEFPSPTGRNIRTPSFDPAGRWILYTDATWHADGPDNNLWVYSTVTGKQYPLFEECEYDQMNASWNPDGTGFCFIRKVGDTNYLYRMDFLIPEAEKQVMSDIDKPLAFELDQNYPNPFNMQTTIGFTIPAPGDVTLTLYSITGQKVRTLVDSRLDPGRHSIVWDGRDDYGMDVASGTYLSRLTCNGGARQGKMTLLK